METLIRADRYAVTHHEINQFFEHFPIEEIRNEIWNLVIAVSRRPDLDFEDPISRSNTIYFCSRLHSLLTKLDSAVSD